MKKRAILLSVLAVLSLVLLLTTVVFASDVSDDFAGLPAGLYASSPQTAVAGKSLTVSSTYASSNSLPASISMYYGTGTPTNLVTAVKSNASVTTYTLNETQYSSAVYTATIPATSMSSGSQMKWYFKTGSQQSAVCTANVTSGNSLPEMLITEIYNNPKGSNTNTYIELTNISGSPLDLYNYKLAYSPTVGATASRSFFISDTAGKYVVQPGKSAVIWFITTTTYSTYSNPTVSNFISKCNADNSAAGLDSSDLIVPINTTSVINNLRVTDADYFVLETLSPMQLYLVRRGEFSTDAVCSAILTETSKDFSADGKSFYYELIYDGTGRLRVAGNAAITPCAIDLSVQTLPSFDDSIIPAVAYNSAMTDTRTFYINAYDETGIVEALMIYKTDKMTEYAEAKLVSDGGNLYSVTLPDELLEAATKITYYFRISDATNTVVCQGGTNVTLVDHSGPQVYAVTPEMYYYYEDVYRPEFSASFKDKNGIKSCTLYLDDTNITSYATVTNGTIKYNGTLVVGSGEHIFTLQLIDNSANQNISEYSLTVYCGDATDMNLYCGEFHSHTSFSDGVLTPTIAYDYARYVGGVDFFTVTDHSSSLDAAEWANIKATADAANDPGEYVAIWGYEQTYSTTTGWWGHFNALNTDTFTTQYTHTMSEFYDFLVSAKTGIGQFNHPGKVWGNFDDYAHYSKTYDKYVNLYEMKGNGYDYEYMLCLNRGWHVSPAHNEDNHSANWTTANEATTYVLSPTLTRQNIIEAVNKNRSYSTTDGTMKLYYKINNEWMGSVLENPTLLNVSVSLSTQKSDGIGTVCLMAEDNIIVAQRNFGTAKSGTWEFSIDADYDYYYVRISGAYYTVTAPIWVERSISSIEISSLDTAIITDAAAATAHSVTATVRNNGKTTLNNVRISFFASNSSETYTSAISLTTASAVANYAIGTLNPGESAKVEIQVSNSNGLRRISAVVDAITPSEFSVGAIETLTLSPIYITEVAPASIGGLYDFVEIYNNNNYSISLNGYYLRVYMATGTSPSTSAGTVVSLNGVTLPERSAVVLWLKDSTNTYTVANFNSYYNVNLVENKNLFIITTVGQLPHNNNNAQQIDIYQSSSANRVSLVTYGHGDAMQSDISTGKSLTYQYDCDISTVMNRYGTKVNPTPGTVAADQVPKTKTSNQVVKISSVAAGVYGVDDAVSKAVQIKSVTGIYSKNPGIPETGDNNTGEIILYAVLLSVTALLFTLTVVFIRKKRKTE